jgi:hypothetical protein
MLKEIQSDAFETAIHGIHNETPLFSKAYFFHEIRVICQTNHPAILDLLDDMLGIFAPPAQVRGELTYYVLCHESASYFPIRLPHTRIRTDTVRLLTDTRLKYYISLDGTIEYQSYLALPPVNGATLTVINRSEPILLTQLEKLEEYSLPFLRRYIFLLALGQSLGRYAFEPCHAAAITTPWDSQQGALIIGVSGSGKTTLSLGCAIAGCGLLGDDLVMLHQQPENGLIQARAITHEVSVRSHSLTLLPNLAFLETYAPDLRDKRYCTIEQIRAGATCLQSTIRLLLFPSLASQGTNRVTRLSKAATLRTLVDLCMSKRNSYSPSQEKLFHLLCQLAEQAPGYQLVIAQDATDGPQLVHALLAGDRHG